jgi:hypothetical protein
LAGCKKRIYAVKAKKCADGRCKGALPESKENKLDFDPKGNDSELSRSGCSTATRLAVQP